MRLYSKKNKEELFDIFNVDINLPTIRCKTIHGNAWTDDPPTKCIDLTFNTQLIYRNDKTHWYFELTILGFGISITRQIDY